MIIHYRNLLTDTVRIGAYKGAVWGIVQKDYIVIWDGGSLGIYSFFAAKTGIRKICAIEYNPIVDVSGKITKDDSLSDMADFNKGIFLS